MNHIRRLQLENDNLRAKLAKLHDHIMIVRGYYLSEKFQILDSAHVRTDVLPRLNDLYRTATEES